VSSRDSGRLPSASLQLLFPATLGILLAISFHAGFVLPKRAAVLLMVFVTAWALVGVRITKRSLLPRFLILAYAMPFSAMVGYLIDDKFVWESTARQLEIASDDRLISEMITLGIIGLLGFLAGVLAARAPSRSRSIENSESEARLPLHLYFSALVLAVFFSWLSAPPETILTAKYAYGQSAAPAAGINFAAAYLVSYITLLILFIDAERERIASIRRLKVITLACAVVYIVVVLQLLRGDRESSGLVVALTALFLTTPYKLSLGSRKAIRRRLVRLTLPLSALVAVFIALGSARSTLSDATEIVPPKQLFLLGLSQNTWTAVLWRNLGVAWEYRTGILHYKLGQTYVDYLLSLPPGVLAKAIGYERPEEAWRGISWEDPAGVSAGGLHAVIAPFKNFGAVGVFAILGLYGFLIGRLELSHARGSFLARLMWAAIFCCGLLWFWYGDMAFIRAMMIAALIYLAYRFAIIARHRLPLGRRNIAVISPGASELSVS
jgi:hypothetical protein